MRGLFKDSSFSARLFQFLLVFFFCFLGGIILGFAFIGDNTEDNVNLKILTLIQSVSSFVLPSFILAYLWSNMPLTFLHLKQKIKWQPVAYVILIMILAIPLINLLADLNQRIVFPGFLSDFETQMKIMEEQSAAQTERLLYTNSFAELLFNIFLVAVIPAFGEELFFRGIMQQIFQKWKGPVIAIWVTAFVFSAVHMQFYGFIPRLLLGAFFGYLVLWSGSLWLPVIAHFTNNLISVVYFYLVHNGYEIINLDSIGTQSTWWIGLISGIIFVSGFLFLKKYFKTLTF